jgi:hypothetical protein
VQQAQRIAASGILWLFKYFIFFEQSANVAVCFSQSPPAAMRKPLAGIVKKRATTRKHLSKAKYFFGIPYTT